MWVIAQIWLVVCIVGACLLLALVTGEPVISVIGGIVLGTIIGGYSMMFASDFASWLSRRRAHNTREDHGP